MASSAVLAVLLGAVSFLPHYAPPACGRRTRVVRTTVNVVASAVSFQSLGVREELCDGLAALGIHEANALQQRAVPAVLGRESLIVGAQTGSGKTLSYLVPVMQSIKADEEGSVARSKPRRPRAIVLVPTRELAVQVHGVAKALSHLVKLSVGLVHGGVPLGPQAKRLDRPTDLLIATPGRLVKLMGEGAVYLGDVRHVVLDEVDTMFDAGFGPELDKVLTVTTRDLAADPNADASGAAVQHLAVGATHPESTIALYDRWLRGARPLMVAGNHMLPPTLRQRFVVCNGPDAKVAALREILGTADSAGRPLGGRVVLFCNSQQSARFVDHTLEEEGYATANYHGAIPANERAANFESFVSGKVRRSLTPSRECIDLRRAELSAIVCLPVTRHRRTYSSPPTLLHAASTTSTSATLCSSIWPKRRQTTSTDVGALREPAGRAMSHRS
jgi:superfamily II DNA/RNA helicase